MMRIGREQQQHELRQAYLTREVETTQTLEVVAVWGLRSDLHGLTANPRMTAKP
jgi:hypothetical protein